MCGIAGIVSKTEKIELSQLDKMAESLYHRGPDASNKNIIKNVGFAHTRLSIIDPTSKGNQPFFNERYMLIYNGEIYNYIKLKHDLESKGYKFKSKSDTEVLFFLLIHYSVDDVLNKINGMFAFAFFDSKKGKLFLCRDRMGIKPLYYYIGNDQLLFGSEIKSISSIVDLKLDIPQTIFSTYWGGDKNISKTLFDQVYQVPPGSYISIHNDKIKVKSYYDILDCVDESYYNELDNASPEEVVNSFSGLINKSIEGMLMSDVPIGAFVSGGVDSSLIAAISGIYNKNITLFSANVLGKYSEIEGAKSLARNLNVGLHQIDHSPNDFLNMWCEATYHYECPIISYESSIPFAQIAQLANRLGVKPVLTGEGADEIFLGYPELILNKYYKYATAPAKLIKSVYGVNSFLRSQIFPDLTKIVAKQIEQLSKGFQIQSLRIQARNAFHFLNEKDRELQSVTPTMLRENLLGLMHRNDRMGMLASIESRFPFLDEEVIKFGINLPSKWKIRFTKMFYSKYHPFIMDKYLVRKLASSLLPKDLAYKRKRGFPTGGLREIVIKPGYFQNSFVEELFKMSKSTQKILHENKDPYFVGRLVSVDIFGKIFGRRENFENVKDHVLSYTDVK